MNTYPALEVYIAIDKWLDDLAANGKSLDPDLPVSDPALITRRDVATLNVAIREIVGGIGAAQ